ncbi:MAG: LapA family protein [Bacillota bacterium]|nr:LapA family protein [Bacillota bacterium]
MQMYLVIALIFALFVAMFAIQNTVPVAISFLFWTFQDISLVLVILGSAVFGAICVFLLGMVKQVSQSMKIKELDNENKRLRAENEDLKEDIRSSKSQQANNFFPEDVRELQTETKEKETEEHSS